MVQGNQRGENPDKAKRLVRGGLKATGLARDGRAAEGSILGMLGLFVNLSQEKGDGIMKGKVLITVMVGLFFMFFVSSIVEAAPGGIAECTTNLAVCNTDLTNAQTMYEVCSTNLTNTQTSLATCQANAQTSLEACQANLATCQDNTTACVQKTPLTSWDKKLPCDSTSNCPRFKLVLDGAAVLDKETGLVWEQSPSTSSSIWLVAQVHCNGLATGGRRGWRLPTLQELASLVDPTQFDPALPAGHPFGNVQSSDYWSATTFATNTSDAYDVDLFNGYVHVDTKGNVIYAWCVRGGQGVDPQ